MPPHLNRSTDQPAIEAMVLGTAWRCLLVIVARAIPIKEQNMRRLFHRILSVRFSRDFGYDDQQFLKSCPECLYTLALVDSK